MAGNDVYLYSVPSDADPDDVRLRDPTTAAASAITGTLSATLGTLTLSSAGQVIIDGDLAATLADLTLSSAGQLVIDGDLSTTLADVTLSSAGQLVIDGDLGATLDALTLSATGTISAAGAITGDLSATLADLTLVSEGTVSGATSGFHNWENEIAHNWGSRRSRAYRVHTYRIEPGRKVKERRRRVTEPAVEAAIDMVRVESPWVFDIIPAAKIKALAPPAIMAGPSNDNAPRLAAAIADWMTAEALRQQDEDDIEMLLLAA